MTNTPNRRRRERATRERADSIVDELRGVPFGLEHRRQLPAAALETAYEQLRKLLEVPDEQLETFRGLLRQHEAPSAETVSAILEASRPTADPSGLTIRYAEGVGPARPELGYLPRRDPELERWLASPAGCELVESLAARSGWTEGAARDALRSVARPHPSASVTVDPEPSALPPRSPQP